jgi:hypothetical protein
MSYTSSEVEDVDDGCSCDNCVNHDDWITDEHSDEMLHVERARSPRGGVGVNTLAKWEKKLSALQSLTQDLHLEKVVLINHKMKRRDGNSNEEEEEGNLPTDADLEVWLVRKVAAKKLAIIKAKKRAFSTLRRQLQMLPQKLVLETSEVPKRGWALVQQYLGDRLCLVRSLDLSLERRAKKVSSAMIAGALAGCKTVKRLKLLIRDEEFPSGSLIVRSVAASVEKVSVTFLDDYLGSESVSDWCDSLRQCRKLAALSWSCSASLDKQACDVLSNGLVTLKTTKMQLDLAVKRLAHSSRCKHS